MNTKTALGSHGVLVAVLIVLYLLSVGMFTYGNYAAGSEPWQVAVSALLLSIPLVLLYFSIGLLIVAGQQRRAGAQINPRMAKYIYWTPRIAGILIVLFVAMFALDVFEGNASIWMKIGGFFIHAAPAIFLAILLVFAWRHPQVGFWAFLLGAVFFMRFVLPRPEQSLVDYLIQDAPIMLLFSGPMGVIAALFWANWKWQPDLRPPKGTPAQ